MSFQEYAKQFITAYDHHFDNDRETLPLFYLPDAMLSFEGQSVAGQEAIKEKFAHLPIGKPVVRIFETADQSKILDIQPAGADGILIVQTAIFKEGEDRAKRYSQTLHVKISGALEDLNTWKILNDIWRIQYPAEN